MADIAKYGDEMLVVGLRWVVMLPSSLTTFNRSSNSRFTQSRKSDATSHVIQSDLHPHMGDSGCGRAVFRDLATRKILTNYTNVPNLWGYLRFLRKTLSHDREPA